MATFTWLSLLSRANQIASNRMNIDRGLYRSHLDEANLIDRDSLLIRPRAREETNRRLPADLLTGETIPLFCQVSMDSRGVMVDIYGRERGQRRLHRVDSPDGSAVLSHRHRGDSLAAGVLTDSSCISIGPYSIEPTKPMRY